MSAPQNFRSAFNGFNRDDVVKYLEYINSRHHAQVNQLTGENDYLRQQLEAAQAASGAQEELQRLQELCASQQVELEELRAVRTAMEARCSGMEKELEDAQEARRRAEEAQSTAQCGVAQELEAYRRAERMERQARERSEQIYRQTNSVLADATVQLEDATGGIFQLADQVMGQLEQLRSAVERSKQALKNASDTMYAIRPQEE